MTDQQSPPAEQPAEQPEPYVPFRLDLSTVTDAEKDRAREARAYVHAATCPTKPIRNPGCPACPTGAGLVLALRVLDATPRDARTARRALHDVVCMSGCGPDSDHADRTQSRPVAALRRFLRESSQGASQEVREAREAGTAA